VRISGWLDLAADMAMLFRIGALGGRSGKWDLIRERLPEVEASMRRWVKSASAMARRRRSWSLDADKEMLDNEPCEGEENYLALLESRREGMNGL